MQLVSARASFRGNMPKLALAAIAAVGAIGGSTAFAAKPDAPNANGNKLQCFSGTTDGGYNGTCTFDGKTAKLNTIDGDLDPNNSYAGVYVQNTNLDGKLIGNVNKLAFTYAGSGATGGSPRLSIPIDVDGNGSTDGYAFVDTLGCNDGNANSGTLDAINDPTCTIAFGPDTYINWAAFVAAHPTYRIASDSVTFVIVDQPGMFTISDVQLGKGPAKPSKS